MTFDFSVIADNWQILAKGFGTTVLMCTVSLPLGFALGVVLALVKLRGGRLPAAGWRLSSALRSFRGLRAPVPLLQRAVEDRPQPEGRDRARSL